MKTKKGFTLMEILTVIAIIGIIMLIAIPSIMGISKSIKRRQLETKKKVIISAAEVYGKNNVSEFGGGDILRIPVRTLLYYGYITKEEECSESIGCIINPVDNSSMNDWIITIKRNLTITQAEWGDEYGNAMCATFDWNDGSNLVENRCCSEALTKCEIKTPLISRNGFDALGWAFSSSSTEGNIGANQKIVITHNETYYGVTRKSVSVSFNPNGGEIISGENKVKCNYYNKETSCAVVAPHVERSGYGLDGWYYSSDERANLSKMSNSATVYAHWNLGEYTITYETNGGVFTGEIKTSYTSEDEFDLPTPQKDGSIFNGWYENSTLTGTRVYKIYKGTTGNKIFYAGWLPCPEGYKPNPEHTACIKNVLTVMYNGNGGTWAANSDLSVDSNGYVTKNGVIYTKEVEYDDLYDSEYGLLDYDNENSVKFKKIGYHGLKNAQWYAEKEGGIKTTFNQDDASITSNSLAEAGGCDLSKQDCEVTLNVNWDINKLYVQYNGNGGTWNSTSELYDVNQWGTVVLESTSTVYTQILEYNSSLSSTGFVNYNGAYFNWTKEGATVESGKEYIIKDANAVLGQEIAYSANELGGYAVGCDFTTNNCVIQLKVNWKNGTYTVAYNGNGGSGIVPNHTCTSSQNCTLSNNSFTRSGYKFSGWKRDNVGDTFAEGAVVNISATGTVTYYAQWTQGNVYTVKYDANGGSGNTPSHTCIYNDTCRLSENSFTRDFYYFVGWKKDNTGNTLQPKTAINFNTTDTITYYAQWAKCSCTGTPGGTCGDGWYADNGQLCVGDHPLVPGDNPSLRAKCCY